MTMQKKKRIFSGIQPTSGLHIGNYLGAIAQWVTHQGEAETIFCVVDLHSFTIPELISPADRKRYCREVVGIYLASGIDPKQSAIFLQSQIREHTELTWVLNCVTPLGWLERMTQFKSKSEGRETVGTGLLDYPVLMAADILVYDTDLVPVGDDQKQHVELTCEIARRFNHLFGQTFVIPKVVIRESGARIMGFDDGTKKMSKSVGEHKPGHMVRILDDEKTIKKTIMSAVTDSVQEVRFEHASPGVLNLLSIYQTITHESKEAIEQRFVGQGYGTLKKAVFECVLELLRPIQAKYNEIIADSTYVDNVIKEGAARIRPTAQAVMQRVRDKVGFE